MNISWQTLICYLNCQEQCCTGQYREDVIRVADGQVSEPEQSALLHTLHRQVSHPPHPDEHRDKDGKLQRNKLSIIIAKSCQLSRDKAAVVWILYYFLYYSTFFTESNLGHQQGL